MRTRDENPELLIRRFFKDNHSVGLLLPDGWFGGRPMESHHQLSFAVVRPKRLIIELDDQLLLVFSGKNFGISVATRNRILNNGTEELVFEDYQQLIFEYLEYGNDNPHVRTYNDGVVCLVSGGNFKLCNSG